MSADRTSTDTEELKRLWREGVATLISYRYFATYSEVVDREHATGHVKIRPDMRAGHGLRAAPLGIALLDTAGISVDPIAVVSPTRIDVELFEPAIGVEALRVDGAIVREGRSQMFTEGRFVDAADPTRVVGTGVTHWSVSGPNPGFNYVDNRANAPKPEDIKPMHEAFGARLRDDGEFEIADLVPELGRRGLHQGPFQVVPESAAIAALERHIGDRSYWIEHQGTSIVSRGTGAPLVTKTDVLRVADDTATVRVELRAAGDGDRLCSLSTYRFRLA
ncbi:MAG: hypothetical protein AB7L13_07360 [Acidimicrobiia bacterium]